MVFIPRARDAAGSKARVRVYERRARRAVRKSHP